MRCKMAGALPVFEKSQTLGGKDYGAVVDAYSEMLSEVLTVPLTRSELARLRYAEDRAAFERQADRDVGTTGE